MKTSPIDWIQLFTLVAVLIGLGLVIYELRQAQMLTRAELAADGYGRLLDKYAFLIGESAAEAFTKNCRGEDLSESEMTQVDAFLRHILTRGQRVRDLERLVGFGYDLDSMSYGTAAEYFSLPRGRERYSDNQSSYPEWFRGAADVVIADGFVIPCESVDA